MSKPTHTGDPKAMEVQIDTIVRRAIADLRALDTGCDCAVLHGVRTMLALALDERVILERDAFAAIDLVEFLGYAQRDRRAVFGLDELTVDGPTDIRAAQGGPLVARITVCVGGGLMEVGDALEFINAEPEGSPN